MPEDPPVTRLGLTGDVMLGRFVDARVLGDLERDPAYLWGDLPALLETVDARLINLECVIASSGAPDPGKIFTFRARPRALDALAAAGVTFAGLANNHVLDYGPDALLECLGLLRAAGIATAGAGRDVAEASSPAVIRTRSLRFGVVAMTDNQPGWEAGDGRPGVNFVRYDAHGLVSGYRKRIRTAVDAARDVSEFVIVCAHLGPNWGTPSRELQAVAHQVLEFGASVYWGHSNHSVQAVEFRDGRVILYSTGDFVDDYAVDPEERNDLSFFFEVVARGGAVGALRLHPVRIAGLRVGRASAGDAGWLRRRVEHLSAPYGTRVDEEHGTLILTA